MRTIKFRAICAFSGVWRYGFYYVSKGNHIIRDENDKESIVLEKTLGQFTGLHDKNGKEIYDGDILVKSNRSGWDLENFVAHEVFFHDNDMCESSIGFQMNRHHFQGSICGTNEYYKFIPKNTKQFEVIGNVFENPELVKL
jgi:uncharacterized phage protein (TIGR01671 family)